MAVIDGRREGGGGGELRNEVEGRKAEIEEVRRSREEDNGRYKKM